MKIRLFHTPIETADGACVQQLRAVVTGADPERDAEVIKQIREWVTSGDVVLVALGDDIQVGWL